MQNQRLRELAKIAAAMVLVEEEKKHGISKSAEWSGLVPLAGGLTGGALGIGRNFLEGLWQLLFGTPRRNPVSDAVNDVSSMRRRSEQFVSNLNRMANEYSNTANRTQNMGGTQ